MSNVYSFSPEAYCKVLLHAVKYPHRSVNGILIGEHEGSRFRISDAIPLFHNLIGVTPMLEVALAQIEGYCRLKGKTIIGYYQANELYKHDSLTLFSTGVGQKILENCTDACVVIISNKNVIPFESDGPASAFSLYLPSDNRGWKEASASKLTIEEGAFDQYQLALADSLDEKLVDFDNYLDCPSADWLNRKLFLPSESSNRAKTD